jgi:hypothetical protein
MKRLQIEVSQHFVKDFVLCFCLLRNLRNITRVTRLCVTSSSCVTVFVVPLTTTTLCTSWPYFRYSFPQTQLSIGIFSHWIFTICHIPTSISSKHLLAIVELNDAVPDYRVAFWKKGFVKLLSSLSANSRTV